jgi:PEP-CTERM motif
MVGKITGVLAIVIGLGLSSQANAGLISFDLNWAGFQSPATATGMVTFDDTVLPNPGAIGFVTAATIGITDFMVTVIGASSGNGTFGLADFSGFVWNTGGSALDLTQELVAQGLADFNVSPFCCGGTPDLTAPEGVSPRLFSTNGGTGDLLYLTSMAPKNVPLPATLTLFGLGLAGLGWTRRKKA